MNSDFAQLLSGTPLLQTDSMYKRSLLNFLLLNLVLLITSWTGIAYSKSQINGPEQDAFYRFRYQIERASAPSLYHKEVTLIITLGESRPVQVRGDGIVHPFRIDATSGHLIVTTAASQLDVTVTLDGSSSNLDDVGAFEHANLYENRGFAWSIGMDDNVGLREQIDALERYGWTGTLFLIANILVDEREEAWILDPPYLRQKLVDGWALGNHTWDHNCGEVGEETIIAGQNRLQQVIDSSERPDYEIISFAAPCFVSDYHPVVLDMRTRGVTSILFNESGNRTPITVDPDPADQFTLIPENPNITAYPFDLDQPIGRASWTDLNDAATEIKIIDAMATRFNETGQHLWHNSLVHGDKAEVIDTVADYLYNTYGPAGTNQIWVAPSDQIVSYILTRDNTTIRLESADAVDEPVEFRLFISLVATE